LSRDKNEIKKLATKGQQIEKPLDLFKEPLVLEFLNIPERNQFSENELETAIISEIEHFMLELGKGFFFGGRQVRFTYDEDNFFVDLVFYNRILNCFVLIDLKIGKLTHQDLGQMQMYVNYYDRFEKSEHENPTIGIVLCKTKSESLVEITLPKNNKQIFASNYLTILPSKLELKNILDRHEQN
jgi:predicted nuclease of restriction endonuclease-like (RecB) superfamily